MWPVPLISVESLSLRSCQRLGHPIYAPLDCQLDGLLLGVAYVFRVYPDRWVQEAPRIDMAHRHRLGCAHGLLRCHRLLPAVYDQTGYWAIRIVTGVPDALPVVGPLLVTLLRGGASVGQGTLSRFYTVHTLVLPLLATAALLVHFLLIRKQGISGPL